MTGCIVIVNYNTAAMVIEALQSLQPQIRELPGIHVALVDNQSPDNSLAVLQNAIDEHGWGHWVHLLPAPRNGGFAYGCNHGTLWAFEQNPQIQWIFMLNPDTLVEADALKHLTQFLESHPRAGIVGAQLFEPDGTLQPAARRKPHPISELIIAARTGLLDRWFRKYKLIGPVQDQATPCDWVGGAALMIRSETLRQAGLMDEGYFLYFEEVDWCSTVRKAGWEVWLEPQARIIHREGAATGIAIRRKRRGRWWYEARYRFYRKWYGLVGLIAADLCWAIGRTFRLIRCLPGLGGSTRDNPRLLSYDLLIGDLGRIFTHKPCRYDLHEEHSRKLIEK